MRFGHSILVSLLIMAAAFPAFAQEDTPVMRYELKAPILFTAPTGGGDTGGGEEDPDGEEPPDMGGNDQPLSLTVLGTLPQHPTVGDAVSIPLQLRGGQPPYDVAIDGANPFSFSSAENQPNDTSLEGIFSQAGLHSFRVVANDSKSPTPASVASDFRTVEVYNPLTASFGAAPAMRVGAPATIAGPSIDGGRGARTLSLIGGKPGGMSFNTSTGVVSGIPSAACSGCAMTVHIEDEDGRETNAVLAYTVNDALTLGIPATSYSWRNNVPISPVQLTASNLIGTPLYEIDQNNLPTGLALDGATGIISGTPTGYGNYGAFRAKVTDSFGSAVTPSVSAVVTGPTISVNSTQNGNVGTAFSVTPTYGQLVSGGSFAREYTLPTAPAGMTIDANGAISWPTPEAGTHPVTIQVRDTDGSLGGASFTLTVSPAVVMDGGLAVASKTSSTVGTTLTTTWTFQQPVYVNRWTAQAKVYKSSGGKPTLYIALEYYDEATSTWVTANYGNYTGTLNATTSSKAEWLGVLNSPTTRIEAKQFRVVLTWGGTTTQTSTNAGVGTPTAMHG